MPPALAEELEDTSPPVLPAEDLAAGTDDFHEHEDHLLGTILAGRYTVTQLIGSGGMGRVYQAFDAAEGHEVAIKVLRGDRVCSASAVQRFLHEARVLSVLSHPNLVRLHDFGQDETGLVFLVMELLQGQDLGRLLHERGRLPWVEASNIALQLVRGLAAAHQRGIVHRDLKPENVYLLPGRIPEMPTVKLLDFGIAKDLQTRDSRLTGEGAVFGTARYMSPEQAAGAAVDGRADVYGVGVLLYEMLTGDAPFQGEGFVQTAHQHMAAPVIPLQQAAPDVVFDPLVEEMVMRALSKDREDRYSSMADFEAAIQAVSIESTMALVIRRPLVEAEPTVVKAPPAAPSPAPKARPRGHTQTQEPGPQQEQDPIDRTVLRPSPNLARAAAPAAPEQTVVVRLPDVDRTRLRAAPVAGTLIPVATLPPPDYDDLRGGTQVGPAPQAPMPPAAPQQHPVPHYPEPPRLDAGPVYAPPPMQAPPRLQPLQPLAGSPVPMAAPRDGFAPLASDARPVFARDVNADLIPAHLSPTRLDHPAQPGLEQGGSPEDVLRTPFLPGGYTHAESSPGPESSWSGDAGALELRLPARETSRNVLVAVVILSAMGLAAILFALWMNLRETPDHSVAKPHPAAVTEQPRLIPMPAPPEEALEITASEPSPPEREQLEPLEPTDEPEPRPRAHTSKRRSPRAAPVSSLSKTLLDKGFRRARPAIDACARTHGAIDGTHLQVSFDVVDGHATSTKVQPPHGLTPLGRCVAAAVQTHARFAAHQQPSRGVTRRVSF